MAKYHQAIELTDNPAEDDANLLDKYLYHRQLAHHFGRMEEADKYASEFKATADKFKPGMPQFERVAEITRNYDALHTSSSESTN